MEAISQGVVQVSSTCEAVRSHAWLSEQAGATILMTNHTEFDNASIRARIMAVRKPGEAHPYVIGGQGVGRYLTVMSECAKAQIARLKTPNS